MNNHILLKFISKDSFAKEFLDGSLYMNSLSFFWNEYPLLQAKKAKETYISSHPEVNPDDVCALIENRMPSKQADMFEGTVGYDPAEGLKSEFGESMLSDAVLRSVGFQYCNTLSFYRLDYRYDGVHLFYDVPNMAEFGDYVAIIKNKGELTRRIGIAAKCEEIDFLCGDIRYKGLKRDGKAVNLSNRHHMVMNAAGTYDISELHPTSKRDCFFKMDKYADQKEWRIAVYRGVKDTKAYRLEIGDIRDIVVCVPTKELVTTVDNLFRLNQIWPSNEGFYGNTTRDEMKEKFYKLGDNKVEKFFALG